MTNPTGQIEIQLSKKKLIFMLVGSFAAVLLGLWLISEADNLTGWRAKNPTNTRIIAILGVFFFGICVVFIVCKLFAYKPGIIIDNVGLTDNSSGVSAGQILWSDVKNIKIIEIHRQKLIMLKVKNPQDYIDRQTNGLKRKMMQINFKMYGTPLIISTNSLQIKFDEILNVLNNHLNKSRQ